MEQIIMAGFGGQGILFLGKVIAEVGMSIGKNVSWIPSYGPEMRGGTANCSVVISDYEIASPIVREPDTLIAMNGPSLAKFEDKIKTNGRMIYNSSIINQNKFRSDIKSWPIPATELANKLGNDKVANIVMVGAYSKLADVISSDDVLKAFSKLIPANKKDLYEVNLAAFKKGLEFADSLN